MAIQIPIDDKEMHPQSRCFRWRETVVIVFLTLFALIGCASKTSTSDTPRDLSEIGRDEIMVVGSISWLKAVNASKLKAETDRFVPFEGERVLLWLQSSLEPVSDDNRLGLLVDWGRLYYFVVPKTTMAVTGLERAYFADDVLAYQPLVVPETLDYLVRVDDSVVYIGHLRVYVNEFDEIQAVEVVDEHRKAWAEISQRFGEALKFRVSLLRPTEAQH